MIGFFFGVYMGGVVVWIWAMCREADERGAVDKQFDDGLSQSMRHITATDVLNSFPDPSDAKQSALRAVTLRVRRRMGQHLAVDSARARLGLGPCTFYSRESRRLDDDGETFI